MATVADRTLWLPRTEAAHFREARAALAAHDPQRFVRLAPGQAFQLQSVRNNAPLLQQLASMNRRCSRHTTPVP